MFEHVGQERGEKAGKFIVITRIEIVAVKGNK